MMATTGLTATKQNILQYLLKQGRATAQQLAKAFDLGEAFFPIAMKSLRFLFWIRWPKLWEKRELARF